MATTANLAATKIEFGQANKETTLNEGLDIFDASIGGILSKSVAGSSNVTLTSTEARNPFISLTGALTGNISVLIPVDAGTGRLRIYCISNGTTGAFAVTIKTTAGGSTGVIVTQGRRTFLAHDGTNVFYAITDTVSLVRQQARAYHSANQSIANVTLTAIALNSERWDNDTIHDTSTNNDRLTCKTAGTYLIIFNAQFDAVAGGTRRIFLIRLNGTTVIGEAEYGAPVAGASVEGCVSTIYPLAVNDFVQSLVYQDSGGAINILAAGNHSPEFMMTRID